MKLISILSILLLFTACKKQSAIEENLLKDTTQNNGYEFIGGYPTETTIQKAYDKADYNRALQTYRFFFPSVSIMGTWKGNLAAGVVPNKVFAMLEGTPNQLVFTPNSDTPYSGLALDLSEYGPMVIELPPGPIMGAANDMNQLYIMDLGLPGPDKGKGGKHIILPPNYKGPVPSGIHTAYSTTNNVLVLIRAIPLKGGPEEAVATIKTIKVYPLNKPSDWKDPTWISLNRKGLDFTPLKWENNLEYWKVLAELVDKEPANPAYRAMYGELAQLGIEKGKPFAPDARMKEILEKAAREGNAIMRVQSFADRSESRKVWEGSQWQWAVLRDKNGTFDTDNFTDIYAREKWFFQAQIESPAMFNRSANAGSLYWLGTKDKTGNYLNGSKNYKLTVPLPVPARLFWSVTIYDSNTRSEILTSQEKAALRSLFELKGKGTTTIDLYFGPTAPEGKKDVWIQTIPNQGWFSYFRIYGPEPAAFNGKWKPGDFEEVK
ncbi:DUF1254 domain-containing protein [Flavobacterium mesophilum]|uniref:DUF1254 domain-containing protein n=1 Tax=Flavobacterium mesophilum TaxID=3143495 RepID=UPI0031D535F5